MAPDHLVFSAGPGVRPAFERLLDELRPGVTEIFAHPATDHSELRSLAPDWETRVDDHHVLTGDVELRTKLERSGAVLIGWRELRDLQRKG